MEGPVRRQTHAHVKVDGLEAYALSVCQCLVQWNIMYYNLFLSFALKPFVHLGVQMVGPVQDPEYVLAGVDGLEQLAVSICWFLISIFNGLTNI